MEILELSYKANRNGECYLLPLEEVSSYLKNKICTYEENTPGLTVYLRKMKSYIYAKIVFT